MALVLKKLYQGYFWLIEEKKDPRTDQFYLLSSPIQPALIGLVYLYLVLNILPKFMNNRPPFQLKKILITYNSLQVLVNAYLFYQAFLEICTLNWYCSPIDYSFTPHNMFVVKLAYVYYLLKLADLFDTIFMVLRGKSTQLSFLHLYHHFGMIAGGWMGSRFLSGGHSIFIGCVNSFVHMIMYFYYLLTIWKPEYKKNIWWKRHITHLQLVQFGFVGVIYGQLLFQPGCTYPKFVSYALPVQSLFMMALFGDFYRKAYLKSKRV